NDVVNPAARHDTGSPIYGMPILDVDKARTVMVIKRSMAPGFAGIENELFYLDKTMMLFGDAKGFVGEIVKELAGSRAVACTAADTSSAGSSAPSRARLRSSAVALLITGRLGLARPPRSAPWRPGWRARVSVGSSPRRCAARACAGGSSWSPSTA